MSDKSDGWGVACTHHNFETIVHVAQERGGCQQHESSGQRMQRSDARVGTTQRIGAGGDRRPNDVQQYRQYAVAHAQNGGRFGREQREMALHPVSGPIRWGKACITLLSG